jgi:hypothetical protein
MVFKTLVIHGFFDEIGMMAVSNAVRTVEQRYKHIDYTVMIHETGVNMDPREVSDFIARTYPKVHQDDPLYVYEKKNCPYAIFPSKEGERLRQCRLSMNHIGDHVYS